MRLGKRPILATAIAGVAFAAIPASAGAATIPVPCGDVAALRAAITTANGTAIEDTIDVTGAPCTFSVADAAVVQAAGNTGLPIITRPLIIEGHGATIRRSGADNYRLIFGSSHDFVTVNRVVLRDLTISNGRLTGGNQNGAGVAGFITDVVLERVTLTQNTAGGRGGAVAVVGGSLDATRSNFGGNVAQFGGAISTSTTSSQNEITRSSIFFNGATGNSGAALIENGNALFENTTVAANNAANGTGGVTAFTSAAGTPADVTVRSSTFGDNGFANQAPPGTSLWALATAGAATITATDTVVADTDSQAPALGAPCLEGAGGSIVASGGNVEWPTQSCDFEVEADPKVAYAFLGAELFARLLAGSAAIDAGGDDCPAVDQFGRSRPGGLACDSGSWETVPPETTVNGPTSPTNAPEVTFTSSQANSTFECRIDGVDPWTVCTSPFTPNLNDGEHTVEVRALNQLGEADPTAGSATFVVDKKAPEVAIDPVTSPTTDPTPDITFAVTDASNIAAVTCKVDDAEPVACSSPFTTPTLQEGSHTVTVEATDAAGNKGSSLVTFVVDLPGETEAPGCRRDTLLVGASCRVTVECPAANSGCTVKGKVDVRGIPTGIVAGDVAAATPVGAPERSASAHCGFPTQIGSFCQASTQAIQVDPGESAFVDCSSSRKLALGVVTLQLRCAAELTKNVGPFD